MAWIKKMAALSILNLVLLSAGAQIIGIQAGIEFNKIRPFPIYDEFTTAWHPGFGFGLTFMHPFKSRSWFSAGLLYSDSRNKITDNGSVNSDTYDLIHQGIRLPL